MNSKPNAVETLIGNTSDYVESRLNLFKLKLVDKSSDIASSIIAFIPLIFIMLIVFILLNIGIALLIGDLIGKAYLGFLILSLIYMITGLVVYNKREQLVKVPFANMLIRKFLKTKV